MNIKAKGTVTIPKLPRSLMALIPWAKSVNLAIQQLRDRTWTASRGGSFQKEKIAPFEVTLKKDGDTYLAVVEQGRVRFVDPATDSEEIVKDWLPEDMDSDPPQEHEVSEGEALYVKIATTNRGVPTSVTIVVDAIDVESIHYQPPPDDPDEVSVEGEYYYKIAEFYTEDDSLKARQIQLGGPVIHSATLWEGKNIGDGDYAVYKQIEPGESTFQFRKLKQGGTDVTGAIPIIKAPDTEVADEIVFKTIAPRESQMQINVEESGDESIVIKGNDFDFDMTLAGGGLLKMVDGLVESATNPTIGSTFHVKVWAGELTYNTGDTQIFYDKGSSPLHNIYFLEGVPSLTEPVDFPSGATVIDLTWVTNE